MNNPLFSNSQPKPPPQPSQAPTNPHLSLENLSHQLSTLKGYTLLLEAKLAAETRIKAFHALKTTLKYMDSKEITNFNQEEEIEWRNMVGVGTVERGRRVAQNLGEKIEVEGRRLGDVGLEMEVEMLRGQRRVEVAGEKIFGVLVGNVRRKKQGGYDLIFSFSKLRANKLDKTPKTFPANHNFVIPNNRFSKSLQHLKPAPIHPNNLSLNTKKAQLLFNFLKPSRPLTLSSAYFRWHLQTPAGSSKISHLSRQLALYTSINKETAGWRLFSLLTNKISLPTKQFTLTLHSLLKNILNKTLRSCFNKIQQSTLSPKIPITRRIITKSNARKREAFRLWKNTANAIKMTQKFLTKTIKNITASVYLVWNIIRRDLPASIDLRKPCNWSPLQPHLWVFSHRYQTTFYCWKSFYEEGRTIKKKAIFTLEQNCQSPQKRYLLFWIKTTKQIQSAKTHRTVKNVFLQLNDTVKKSISALFTYLNNLPKMSQILTQIFDLCNQNLAKSFNIWSEDIINERIYRDQQTLSRNNTQKSLILALIQLENADKLKKLQNLQIIEQLKAAIWKFRSHWRATETKHKLLVAIIRKYIAPILITFTTMRTHRPIYTCSTLAAKYKNFVDRLAAMSNKKQTYLFQCLKQDLESGKFLKKDILLKMTLRSVTRMGWGYKRWAGIVGNERNSKIIRFVESLDRCLETNVSHLINLKQLEINRVKRLRRILQRVMENGTNIVQAALARWEENTLVGRKNQWWGKGAYQLALNTTLDLQKSLWRLQHNTTVKSRTQLSKQDCLVLLRMANRIEGLAKLTLVKSFYDIRYYRNLESKSQEQEETRQLSGKPQTKKNNPPTKPRI